MSNDIKLLSDRHASSVGKMENAGVRLINYDSEAPYKVAAALLFEHSQAGLYELKSFVDNCLRRSSIGSSIQRRISAKIGGTNLLGL